MRAVLLDLDGTLVDTTASWHAAYLTLADEFGVRAPEDLWTRVVGRSMRASLDVLVPTTDVAELDALVGRLVAHAATNVRAAGGWRWLPGAHALLIALRSGEPPRPGVALVTSAWRAFTIPLLEAALGGTGDVTATFDAIVCGDDVTDGKPAPDSHLRAAALLATDPADCLVIEDSPTGVAAAEAAGMSVLVVPHAGPIAEAPGRLVRDDLVGLRVETLAALHARIRSSSIETQVSDEEE